MGREKSPMTISPCQSYHTTVALDVQRHHNEQTFIKLAPKSGSTCTLKKHLVSVFFVSVRLDFDHKVHQSINGNMNIA
jgi:hypothetical protein